MRFRPNSVRSLTVELVALLFLVWCARADPVWRFSNPAPHGANILDMGMSQDVVWQVGERGNIYTSPDLDNWFPRDSGTTKSLRSIAFFQGKALISAEAGTILVGNSPDDLSELSLGTVDWLEGIAASSNLVVTVGDNGAIYSSPNATSWSRRGNFTTWLRSVGYGNGIFVCVGEGGFIATSGDGVSWLKRTVSTTADLNKVAYVNDRFWIVGDQGTVLTNNFRFSFIPVELGFTNSLYAVAGNSNEVVLAGDSVVMLGNLGNGTWSSQSDATSPALAPAWPYYSALWDGRLFLLGGRTGMQVQGYRTNSSGPMVWYADSEAPRDWIWSATHITNLFAAVGAEGTIVTSVDGIDWNREAVPAPVQSEVLLGIAGNSQALVAVGSSGTILRSGNLLTNIVSTEPDGHTVTNQANLIGVIWSQKTSPTQNDLQAVAASDSQFIVAGGQGTILASSDGSQWQSRPSPVSAYLSGATAWKGGFVLSGASGTILTSANGASWSVKNSGVTQWVYAVRFVGGRLVAVGEGGLILTSDDAVHWQKRSSGVTEWIDDVTFSAGRWYAVAGAGIVVTSTDSINWTPIRTVTSKSLYAATSDGSQLIVAGMEGVILRAELNPVTSPVNFVSYAKLQDTSLFLFGGAPDQRFSLESKDRVQDPWTILDTLELVNSSGTLVYERPLEPSRAKFFRTRLLTP
jgi:hypothetical protein